MPVKYINVYLQALPKLKAEEDLRSVSNLWIAQPSNTDEEVSSKQQALDSLKEQAGYHVPKLTEYQEQALLASMGVKVINVNPVKE